MKQIFWLSFLVTLVFSPYTLGADKNKTIHIVSQTWDNYAEENCQGYMWKLVKTVFEEQGYQIKCSIIPYKRGVEMVKRGLADAWLASYKDEQKFAIYPKWPHDFELTGVAATKETMKKWKTNSNLDGRTVAYVRGYELDGYITDDFKKIEVNDLKQGLDLVLAGRSEFVADDSDDMREFLDAHPGYRRSISVKPLFKLALYLAFNDSARSRKLIDAWDQSFPQLLKESEIRQIYEDAGKGENYIDYWHDYNAP